MAQDRGLVQGTLDMLILRVLDRGSFHGLAIVERIEQLSRNALRVEKGSLYPALYRMEEKGWIKGDWQVTESGQRARYYGLTAKGRKQLETQKASWDRMIAGIAGVMEAQ